MKKLTAALALSALLATAVISAKGFSPGDSLSRLKLQNVQSGSKEHFQTSPQTKLRAIIFLSPECPICKNYSLTLNQFAEKYKNEIVFIGIVPGRSYTISDTRSFVNKYKISFNVYLDPSLSASKLLRAETTPEVFLVDAADHILYSGAVDNWFRRLGVNAPKATEFYLQDAIEEILADRPVVTKYKKPVGCSINDY